VLDPDVCDRARVARDARFDGRFFTGVLTTHVYCRPICPVRPARSANVRFFPSAGAAEEAGFRPCLRCRPELAPDADVQSSVAVVARGVKLINRGFLDGHTVLELASELAVGERQLTRLFRRQLGTTPGALARTRRVQLAKRLLDETRMPIIQVAFAAGFSSLRRFNAAFTETYRRSPAQMRRGPRHSLDQSPITLRLPFRPPLDWASLLLLLKADVTPGVESVASGIYRRTVRVDGHPGWFEVSTVPGECYLRLRLRLADYASIGRIIERVRGIFDLSANPEQVRSQLGRDCQLARLLIEIPDLRLPGTWDGFEVAVRAVVVDDVGHARATEAMHGLALSYGQCLELGQPGGPDVVFPTPATLTRADLAGCGLSDRGNERVRRLAQATLDGLISFEPAADFGTLWTSLAQVGGFDQPTAQWIAMRALGEPDALLFGTRAFVGTDVLEQLSVTEHEAWQPWRSYVAVLLQLKHLKRMRAIL
jgi:AraC family transcriptional regulator, regulatory protein of adaptative response / DNA-3-methyladenine glycosylase II